MKIKTGLVMEGGAMRGMFTAGVTDVLMENGIEFDGGIGTSAGAVFGCNYKSHQIGRVIRYNKKYCRDKRFASIHSLITTGNLFGVDFGYYQIPNTLDVFDAETFKNSPMEFYAVCTDMITGRAVYHRCDDGGDIDIDWLRASASMPLAATPVYIEDYILSDGGIADSIPLKHFEELGYERNVVILTQPSDYVKKKNKLMPILKIAYRKYPEFIKAMKNRHNCYNKTLKYINERRKTGDVLVIQPSESLNIGHIEHNPNELERVYRIGRKTAEERLDDVREFLKK